MDDFVTESHDHRSSPERMAGVGSALEARLHGGTHPTPLDPLDPDGRRSR